MGRLIRYMLLIWLLPGALWAGTVIVFAAASLKTALDALAAQYTQQTGEPVVLSYGGSSALARQILQGAPADLFVSANPGWMDVVDQAGLIQPGSRVDLLGNRLVLIAPAGSDVQFTPGDDLGALLGDGHLSMAMVQAVPAGIYGQAALQSLDQWDAIAGQIAQSDNVRAALRLVALGEAPLGIVYDTDARADPQVQILHRFAPDTHPPITYPMAQITPDADGFARFLRSDAARALFDRYGFSQP